MAGLTILNVSGKLTRMDTDYEITGGPMDII